MPEKILRGSDVFFPLTIASHNNHILFVHTFDKEGQKGFFLSKSADGLDFTGSHELIILSENGKEERITHCDTFHLSSFGNEHYIIYSQTSSGFFRKKTQTTIAKSNDMIHFKVIDRFQDTTFKNMKVVSSHRHKKNFLAYHGGDTIRVGASTDLKNWHKTGDLLAPRKDFFDNEALDIIDILTTPRGLLVVYRANKNDKHSQEVQIGAALFSLDRPYEILWRSNKPVWEKTVEKKDLPLKQLGCAFINDHLRIYWASAQNEILIASIRPTVLGFKRKNAVNHFNRHTANPILKPNIRSTWENEGVFNPAALHLGDKVHLIYRAIGESGASCFGYAASEDGINFEERLSYPVYEKSAPTATPPHERIYSPVMYPSGGSWGGYEDPRMVEIDGHVYVTFNLFDNWTLRVGVISLSKEDFLAKRFDKWDGPHILSHGNRDKNWVLFPEKIKGKFAVLHSIIGKSDDHVRIEYINNLKDLRKKKFESPDPQKIPDKELAWHMHVRSAGPPPLKTAKGWLLFYHANDMENHKYKVGAMLLDLKNPSKILARAEAPILEPDFHYENDGKPGIVYAAGAIIKDGKIHLYYGGADKVTCVAIADADLFLDDLMKGKTKKKTPRAKKANKSKKTRYASHQKIIA